MICSFGAITTRFETAWTDGGLLHEAHKVENLSAIERIDLPEFTPS